MSRPGEPWGKDDHSHYLPGDIRDVAVLLKHVRKQAIQLANEGVQLPESVGVYGSTLGKVAR
jgi:hypothetical protein